MWVGYIEKINQTIDQIAFAQEPESCLHSLDLGPFECSLEIQ